MSPRPCFFIFWNARFCTEEYDQGLWWIVIRQREFFLDRQTERVRWVDSLSFWPRTRLMALDIITENELYRTCMVLQLLQLHIHSSTVCYLQLSVTAESLSCQQSQPPSVDKSKRTRALSYRQHVLHIWVSFAGTSKFVLLDKKKKSPLRWRRQQWSLSLSRHSFCQRISTTQFLELGPIFLHLSDIHSRNVIDLCTSDVWGKKTSRFG